jgi:tRNA 2-thiouridine synthesizing protein A
MTCPIPVLRTNKALRDMAAGTTLTVLATDPAALKDFPAYAEETGHTLLSSETGPDGVHRFVLRRKSAP